MAIACALSALVATYAAAKEEAPIDTSLPAGPVDIDEYIVDGNTVLSTAEIERAVYAHLGPGRPASEIEAARAALEKAFQDKGYQTVQVQIASEDEPGVIHLAVTELKVGRLRVTGARYYLPSEIKKEAPSVVEGIVPNFNDLRADLGTLNQIPGRQVTPELKAGVDPGTVDVALVVKDDFPAHISVDVNNQHGLDTTPLRTSITGSYDNLWQAGHKIMLTYQTAPENPSDTSVFSGSYLARFVGSPYSLLFSGTVSNSNVAAVAGTDLIGKGTTVGVRGLAALPGDEDFTQSVQAGVDYKAFRNTTQVAGSADSAQIIPVSYFPISVNYSAIVTEDDGQTSNSANLTLILAPPRTGSDRFELDTNRYGARGQDLAFRASLDREQDVYAGFRLRARLDGQLTDQPLVSNEQFPLGGANSVRGYLEAENLVDTGASGGLELISPSLPDVANDWLFGGKIDSKLTLHGFADGGTGYIHDPLPGQKFTFTLASVGIGAEGNLSDFLYGGIDLAIPLLKTENTKAHSPEILFHVSTVY
jgi:hemolysin activation/secretion protein